MLPPTPPASPKPTGYCLTDPRLGLILADRIRLTNVLGTGAYGTVYQAEDVESGEQYAVKALNKAGLDPRQRMFQQREIELHYLASKHSNVVAMHKILDSPDCTFVVLEFCPEGDLFSKITEDGQYVDNDFMAKHAFLQILDAVAYCHSQRIYHRDLKPENVLVKDNGWTVKLADFGLATRDDITADFGCGSTFYMSPECQQLDPHPNASYRSAANDVWSLGVILVNLTCGRNPWKRASMEDSTFNAFMRDPNFLQSILPVSGELNAILRRIFDVNPLSRITLKELAVAIERCPRLTQRSSAPPTPPYSPLETTPACSTFPTQNVPETVPHFDQLPAQQYPKENQGFVTQQPPVFTAQLPTPPHSADNSPRQHPYTFQPKPVVFAAPFTNAAGFFAPVQAWQRCGQFIPAFHAPRPQCYWPVAY